MSEEDRIAPEEEAVEYLKGHALRERWRAFRTWVERNGAQASAITMMMATVVYAAVAFFQWRELSRTNDLAYLAIQTNALSSRRADRTAIQQLRLAAMVEEPRLEIVGAWPIPGPLQRGRMRTNVFLKNTGRTPAYNLHVNARIDILPAKVSDLLREVSKDAGRKELKPGEVAGWDATSQMFTERDGTSWTNPALTVAYLHVDAVYHTMIGERALLVGLSTVESENGRVGSMRVSAVPARDRDLGERLADSSGVVQGAGGGPVEIGALGCGHP